ncbi:Uncharacterized protein SCF082_LOCUS508, partial [Durusdinium trenchii]
KLSGWHLVPESFVMDATCKKFLQPSRVQYDAMHIYFSNGIVGQELGLIFSAAMDAGLNQEALGNFLALPWAAPQSKKIAAFQLRELAKLLKRGSDFKGDASQTLHMLPLMAFFSSEVLSGIEALSLQCASLEKLNLVCLQIQASKQNAKAANGLSDAQRSHFQAFKAAYASEAARPKHHYAFHLEAQVAASACMLDCFTCERKNKKFISIAENIVKLQDFEKSVLLRWLEADAEQCLRLTEDMPDHEVLSSPSALLPPDVLGEHVTISKCMYCPWGTISAGDFFLEGQDAAYKILACMLRDGSGEVLALQHDRLLSRGPEMSWSKWSNGNRAVLIPVEIVMHMAAVSFACADDGQIYLLR